MKMFVLPGDDIGPEIIEATLEVLAAADRRFGFGIELERDCVGFANTDPRAFLRHRLDRTHGIQFLYSLRQEPLIRTANR